MRTDPKGGLAEAWLITFCAIQGVGGAIMFPAALIALVLIAVSRPRTEFEAAPIDYRGLVLSVAEIGRAHV